jgi:hypothetical protein
MKSIFTILLLSFIFLNSTAQDRITIKKGQQLDVRIIEKTNKMVKYKMADYEDGPVLWIKLKRLSGIEYKNGIIDRLGYQNPRKSRPLGINAGGAFAPVGKSGFFSTTIDYFVIPQVDLEINIGTSDITSYGVYFSAGSRFHINSDNSEKKLTPFTGLLVGSNYGDGFIQIPGGFNYLTDIGINGSLSLNEMIGFNSWLVTFIEVRIGWRF